MSNILQRANDIVNKRSEERDRQYGPFNQCMERTGQLASQMCGRQITAVEAFKVLIALKLSREAYMHKEDNLLDAAAYIGGLNNYIEDQKSGQLELPFNEEQHNEEHAVISTNTLKMAKVRPVKDPVYSSDGAAGIDFFVPEDFGGIMLTPGEDALIPSGIKVNIPKGMCLLAVNKSGVASTKQAKLNADMKIKDAPQGLIVGACLIDCDYQGEIHLHLINYSTKNVFIRSNDKLAQFVYLPAPQANINIVHPDDLYAETTGRGTGGFGSTN